MFLKQLSGSLPIIFVIVLIVAALFSWFLYRTVSRPILMLVECMRSLETLDFAPPDLDITRTDELGYLNRSYLLLLDELNRRYIPNFNPSKEEGYIQLTTHNYQAQRINEHELAQLPGRSFTFRAQIDGKFPEYSYPTDEVL